MTPLICFLWLHYGLCMIKRPAGSNGLAGLDGNRRCHSPSRPAWLSGSGQAASSGRCGFVTRGLATGEGKAERTSLILTSGMDLARKAAAWPTKSLRMSTSFAPMACECAPTTVPSTLCCQLSVSSRSTRVCSRASHTLCSAQGRNLT